MLDVVQLSSTSVLGVASVVRQIRQQTANPATNKKQETRNNRTSEINWILESYICFTTLLLGFHDRIMY